MSSDTEMGENREIERWRDRELVLRAKKRKEKKDRQKAPKKIK